MFAVGKASDEPMERNEIDRMKHFLKKKLKNEVFHLEDLKDIYPGASELMLLTENIRLKKVHVNLIYAFTELYQGGQIDVVSRDPLSFRIKLDTTGKARKGINLQVQSLWKHKVKPNLMSQPRNL